MRYIDADTSVDIGYLSDWYQNSIDDTKPPIWTDEHLEELTNDFIIIPKDTPTADVVEVKHARWKNISGFDVCNICGTSPAYWEPEPNNPKGYPPYCPNCGAKMDGGVNDG